MIVLNISKNLKQHKQTIFLFHGVIHKHKNKIRNYNRKHISKDDFYKFLKKIKKIGTSISMDELHYFYVNNIKIPKYSYCITFDDGFYNNYKYAAPILDDLKIKSTFYICSDFVQKNRMSWIDRIESVVENLNSGSIKFNNTELSFVNSIKSKIQFLEYIRKVIKSSKIYDPIKFADHFQKKMLNMTYDQSNDILDKKMTIKQIKSINQNKLFTVGGHSHKHKIFSQMTLNEVNNDISKSINYFKKFLQCDIRHYSYPEGQKDSFSKREINILKKKKILCCPNAVYGFNTNKTNLFNLNRVFVK